MDFTEIYIETDEIKLDQFLKYAGILQTGGQTKFLLEDEMLLVNGEIPTGRSMKLKAEDKVEIIDHETFIIKKE